MTPTSDDVPNKKEIDLEEAEVVRPEGKGIDGSREKEIDKQLNEPTDTAHA